MLSTTRAHLLLGSAALVATASLYASPGLAQEGSETGSMTVTTEVVQGCALSTINSLDFGMYVPGTEKESDADIVVNCSAEGNIALALDQGQRAPISGKRTMKNTDGNQLIQYDLYSNADRTVTWSPDMEIHENVQSGDNTFTVWGVIPVTANNESVPPATYEDTLTVTLTF